MVSLSLNLVTGPESPELAKAEILRGCKSQQRCSYPLTIPMLSLRFLCIRISCIRTVKTAITKKRDKSK